MVAALAADERMPDWPYANQHQASLEGWDLFDSDGSLNGPWQIQSFDDPPDELPYLGCDEAAWLIVWSRALHGSPLHVQVLDIVRDLNPPEFECIQRFVLRWFGVAS